MSAFGGSTSLIQAMAAVAAQGNASIRNCNDVSLTNPQSNDTLAYNALANVWVNQPLTIINNNDTLITNPTNNQVLAYNSTDAKWENQTLPSGVSALADLTDVTLTTLANGDVLTYNTSLSKWDNATPVSVTVALASCSDVSITSPATNNFLQYNATAGKWENTSVTIDTTIASLSDTSITAPTSNQFLQYNATTSKWQNQSVTIDTTLASLSDTSISEGVGIDQNFLFWNNTDSKWEAKLLQSSDIPSLAESKITNLTSDLSSKVSSINSITPTSGNVTLALTNLSNVNATAPTDNNGLVYSTTTSTWNSQQISHTTLSSIGTNTHSQIDTFIGTKGQANGLATLDSGTNLPLSQLGNCVNNTICLYVDGKYTGAVNDGSILKPYTTISVALALISPWANSSDPHIADRYVIHVAGGAYDESLTIPNFSHVTLVADGLVYLGATTLQYFEGMSSAGHVRDAR